MGAAVDHMRHESRFAGVGANAPDGRPFSVLRAHRFAGRDAERAEVTRARPVRPAARTGDIRQGFVYERVPARYAARAIANNTEIDVIWDAIAAEAGAAARRLESAALKTDMAGMGSSTRV